MACCSSTKTEQFVNTTAETAKAFAAGAKAFINSPSCLTPEAALPSQFYGSFTATWGVVLLISSWATTFRISDACSSDRAL
jgi:hypothetical protein